MITGKLPLLFPFAGSVLFLFFVVVVAVVVIFDVVASQEILDVTGESSTIQSKNRKMH